MNKKIAIAILNRNSPELANNFVERMIKELSGYITEKDIFVLENGSEEKSYSKYGNIIEKNSFGVGWGMNKLINTCYDLGYEYIWLSHNDAFLENPRGFLEWSFSNFDKDSSVGVTLPWKDSWQWGLQSNELGRSKQNQNVSFWDHISTIFSRKSIEVTKSFDENFDPFVSSNFCGHYLMLCPALALYSNNMRIITNSKFLVEEINLYTKDNKEDVSIEVRGFGDAEWKSIVGPDSIRDWFDKVFPGQSNSYNLKQKRNMLIRRVCSMSLNNSSVR